MTRGEPEEERGASCQETVVEKHEGCNEITRRVHETATDSTAC